MWWQLILVLFHSSSPPSHLPLFHPGRTAAHTHLFVGQAVLKDSVL